MADVADEAQRTAEIARVASRLARLDAQRARLVGELRALVAELPAGKGYRGDLGAGATIRKVVESPVAGSLFDSIRKFLAADPERDYPARDIAAACNVSLEDEEAQKSFYSSLAKLAHTGQIRRTRRGRYQALPAAEPAAADS